MWGGGHYQRLSVAKVDKTRTEEELSVIEMLHYLQYYTHDEKNWVDPSTYRHYGQN